MKKTDFTCDLCVAAIDEHRHGFAIRWANSKIELCRNRDDSGRHICIVCVDNLIHAAERFAQLIPYFKERQEPKIHYGAQSTDAYVADAVMRERLACANIAAKMSIRAATDGQPCGEHAETRASVAHQIEGAILSRTPSVAMGDKS